MRRTLLALLISALTAAACSDDRDAGAVADENAITTTTAALSTTTAVSDDSGTGDGDDEPPLFGLPVLTPSPVSPLAATLELETGQSVELRITATSGDHTVITPWTAEPARDHLLPLVGLRSERTYDVEIEARLSDGETAFVGTAFTTGALPDNIPDFTLTIDADRSAPGVTILELNPVQAVLNGIGNPIVGIDDEGEVVWYYQSSAISGAFTGAVQQGPNGTVYAQNHPFGAREFTIDASANAVTPSALLDVVATASRALSSVASSARARDVPASTSRAFAFAIAFAFARDIESRRRGLPNLSRTRVFTARARA